MTLTIFYDDSCPICRTEILGFYSVYPKDMNLISLSQGTDELKQHNIQLEDALTLMHVIDEQGELHIGMDAIRVMYRRLGKPKTAWFTSLPVLNWFLRLAVPDICAPSLQNACVAVGYQRERCERRVSRRLLPNARAAKSRPNQETRP